MLACVPVSILETHVNNTKGPSQNRSFCRTSSQCNYTTKKNHTEVHLNSTFPFISKLNVFWLSPAVSLIFSIDTIILKFEENGWSFYIDGSSIDYYSDPNVLHEKKNCVCVYILLKFVSFLVKIYNIWHFKHRPEYQEFTLYLASSFSRYLKVFIMKLESLLRKCVLKYYSVQRLLLSWNVTSFLLQSCFCSYSLDSLCLRTSIKFFYFWKECHIRDDSMPFSQSPIKPWLRKACLQRLISNNKDYMIVW